MGVIRRVADGRLGRQLAMKIVRTRDGTGSPAPSGDARRLQRFLNEARITSQLQHPGIVPVHEVGVDGEGRAFFTMKLVQGRTLEAVFMALRRGDREWNRNRVLADIGRVCEAMAYAHDRGVVHRDLKPANIMVGDFGEVYVMDWGLARRLDEADIGRAEDAVAAVVDAELERQLNMTLTRMGDVLGTPAYMSPEQAAGRLDEIDGASDIYAIGAMLYELVAGHRPYCEPGGPDGETSPPHLDGRTLAARIVAGPPRLLDNREVAPELISICNRAMQHDRRGRYPSMKALADDMRRLLEGRVVHAHATGAWAEAVKWVQRNRGLSAALFAVLVTAVFGFFIASGFAVEAGANAEVAGRTVSQFEQLAARVRLDDAFLAEQGLFPAWPENRKRIEDWLRVQVGTLVDMMPDVERTIVELDEEATTASAGGGLSRPSRALLRATLAALRPDVEKLEADAARICASDLPWAMNVGRWMKDKHPKARCSWVDAATAIARADGVTASTRYRDVPIALNAQMGLVPIGMNPCTKLWEFYDLRSAWDPFSNVDPADIEIPEFDPEGRIAVGEDTGIVFVLVPGGAFIMGSPKGETDETDENGGRVCLSPFFLARHELSQAQWQRLGNGGNDSRWRRGGPDTEKLPVGPTHPVDTISWLAADAVLRRNGMDLPTEAQWEYAARAGTTTPWWLGQYDELASLGRERLSACNLADKAFMTSYQMINCEAWNDGFVATAPVDWGVDNAFGFFNVHGNVWEWCRDWKCVYDEGTPVQPGTGLREPGPKDAASNQVKHKVYRGGSYLWRASEARSANRQSQYPDMKGDDLGVRPMRPLR
ncbi:MAG: bifunctional serine/threonine-protein kinase/formylglycine-generating enzyme family protein [Planctomycetota bacterium]